MTNKHRKVWKVVSKTTFRKTNTAKRENTFLETKPNFPLTGKCFPLTNFSNRKQIQKNLKNSFSKTTFQETTKKQTWPKYQSSILHKKVKEKVRYINVYLER